MSDYYVAIMSQPGLSDMPVSDKPDSTVTISAQIIKFVAVWDFLTVKNSGFSYFEPIFSLK